MIKSVKLSNLLLMLPIDKSALFVYGDGETALQY